MNRNDNEIIDKYIGQVIKNKRTKLGISLVDFAHEFNMSKGRYGNYENGSRSLSIDMYIDICKRLKINAEKLYKDAQDYQRKEMFKNADI